MFCVIPQPRYENILSLTDEKLRDELLMIEDANREEQFYVKASLKEYLNAINHTKERLLDSEDEEWEKKYPPFIVNKCVYPFQDTIMLVNEINQLPHLDKKLQFDFLLNSIRSRKRFTPWIEGEKLKTWSMLKSIMVTVMTKQSKKLIF